MAVIMVAGPAGSGKSTLGRALARNLQVPLIDLDSVTNPLLNALGAEATGGHHWNSPRVRERVRPARYAALRAVIDDQRTIGMDAVVVAPFTAELRGEAEWEALAKTSETSADLPVVVWLRATPELCAARRAMRGADRDHNAVNPDEKNIELLTAEAPRIPHLALDAQLTTEQQLAAVRRHLRCGRHLDSAAPIFNRTFTAALFDLDGTLVDSTASITRSWATLARELGIETDLLAIGHGQPARQVIAMSVPTDLRERALQRVTELEVTDVADVVALPGSSELFTSLDNTTRAIVTSGSRLLARARLAAANIVEPAIFVTIDDVTHGKPHPEPFLRAAELLKVDPADCLVFEDAPAGLAAARAAGCATVGVVGTHRAEELSADILVDGLYQLHSLSAPSGGFRLQPTM